MNNIIKDIISKKENQKGIHTLQNFKKFNIFGRHHYYFILSFFSVMGTFWKFARIGERKSPYVSVFCLGLAMASLFM